MDPQQSYGFLPALVEQYYGLKMTGEPELLNERDGQLVFKANLEDGAALTVRLCPIYVSEEKVLSDTGALLFLNNAGFPAPHLRLTLQGERVFLWQPGSWGYAHDFIEGQHPQLEPSTLTELGHLLGRLHSLASKPEDYPVRVRWLDDLPHAIRRAELSSENPDWGKKAAEVAASLKDLPDLSNLPLGLIHTDVHEGNLLRAPDGKLYMLDWEDAGLGEALFDLALVLGWNCVWQHRGGLDFLKRDRNRPPDLYDFDELHCRSFLQAYQQERPLDQLEMALLGPAIRFVMGWFASRDIVREIQEPGVSHGLAHTNWAIMRSVTPAWSETLSNWAWQTRPPAS
ncbi:MAG TPA: phosphotransferase [Chloroflexia bacterium]|nr:phosphotransferase [Chloroflexia bacterium]